MLGYIRLTASGASVQCEPCKRTKETGANSMATLLESVPETPVARWAVWPHCALVYRCVTRSTWDWHPALGVHPANRAHRDNHGVRVSMSVKCHSPRGWGGHPLSKVKPWTQGEACVAIDRV